jgi:26S proteasome regulatory subunit T3|uniref:Proteasomal ATPase second OB domain-containing protein n=1 Tax=Populus trichocarpa TaxID=3694 RepID=A0A3N7F813_POPTR|eukprot:XP_024460496.1 26S proteasome regulatory subunit 6B homolog [Populus trichocarpa]
MGQNSKTIPDFFFFLDFLHCTPAISLSLSPNQRIMSTMVLDLRPAATVEPRSDLVPDPTAVPTEDDNLYSRFKSLQRQLEFIDIQEEYVKDEQKNLKRELLRAQEEVKRIQSVPLVSGQFMEMVDQNNGIVGSTTGSNNYYVRILSTINWELLKASTSMALHGQSNALVDVLPPEADSSISLLSQSEKPDVTYNVCEKVFFGGFWIWGF